MKDKLKAQGNAAPKGSRSYSTMTTQTGGSSGPDMGLVNVQSATTLQQIPGLKFEMPSLPLPRNSHVKRRYDPVVEQVTNLLMRHGKKSVAQSVSFTAPSTRVWADSEQEHGTDTPVPANISNSHHQPCEAPPSGSATTITPAS